MKVRIVISIIIFFLLALLLIAEDPAMITGRERREQATTAGSWDNWYALNLPGMDEVLVTSKKFSFDIGGGRDWVVDVDIYYPPDFNFSTKLPAVFIGRGRPLWKSAISFGQLVAASGLIAVIPDISMGESFAESITYIMKNAREFSIDKRYIGIWGGGHPGAYAFNTALDKSFKYHKYIKCAVFEAAVLQFYLSDKEIMSNDVPLLFITGSRDLMAKPTHPAFLEVASELNIPLEYVVYDEAGHNWYKDNTDEARDFIEKEIDFFRSHLLLEQ